MLNFLKSSLLLISNKLVWRFWPIFVSIGLFLINMEGNAFRQLNFNGNLYNQHSNLIQISFLVFALTAFCTANLFKKNLLSYFFLFVSLILVTYSPRLAQPYLFQDDWYHMLTVSRGGWDGLWIPFVDHITPVWRLFHLIIHETLGSYNGVLAFPYIGVLCIALVGIGLVYVLKKLNVPYPQFWGILLITYPGYPSVMYWISTNAVALSAGFGIFALYIQTKLMTNAKMETDLKNSGIIVQSALLLFCSLSFLTWTTGLVYPLMCIFLALFFSVAGQTSKSFKQKNITFLKYASGAIFSLFVFLLVRFITYKFYPSEDVSKIIWTANSLHHGHHVNYLRPLFWPIMSVFDGVLLIGQLNIHLSNENFYYVIARGLVFLALILVVSKYFKGYGKYFLFAYIFGFLSFLIIFLGRGTNGITHRTPHGYLEYALSNDWYRISAFTGILFFIAIGCSKFLNFKKVKKLSIFIFIILLIHNLMVLGKRAYIGHPLSFRSQGMSKYYEGLSCMNKLKWSNSDFIFASRHLFLPMIGSNPGNFWLQYEPSWFDLYIKDGENLWSPSTVLYSQERARKLKNQFEKVCNNFDYFDEFNEKRAIQIGQHPASHSLEVSYEYIDPTHEYNLSNYSQKSKCLMADYQYVELEIRKEQSQIKKVKGLILDFGMSLHWEIPDERIQQTQSLTIDTRSLSPDERCSEKLKLRVNSSHYKVTKILLKPSPMNSVYYD